MNYQEKYVKYKNKYLNLRYQIGGNHYAHVNYDIDDDGNILKINKRVTNNTYKNLILEDFRGVFNSKKVCMNIYPDDFNMLFSKINVEICNYNDLLVYILKNNEITNIKPLENEDILIILLFSDIISKNIFLKILNDNIDFILPHKYKTIFLNTWNTIYDQTILTDITIFNIYINFAIFSGIIFSYDIKDIYGFIKEKIDENKLDILFNKTLFFCRLQKIILYIKTIHSQLEKPPIEASSSNLKLIRENVKYKYTNKCQLCEYVIAIEDTNMPKTNSTNFNKIISNTTLYDGYSACVKSKVKPKVKT